MFFFIVFPDGSDSEDRSDRENSHSPDPHSMNHNIHHSQERPLALNLAVSIYNFYHFYNIHWKNLLFSQICSKLPFQKFIKQESFHLYSENDPLVLLETDPDYDKTNETWSNIRHVFLLFTLRHMSMFHLFYR